MERDGFRQRDAPSRWPAIAPGVLETPNLYLVADCPVTLSSTRRKSEQMSALDSPCGKEIKEGDVLFSFNRNAVRCSDCQQIKKLSRSGYTTRNHPGGQTLTFIFICIECDYPDRVIPHEIKEHEAPDAILDAEVVA